MSHLEIIVAKPFAHENTFRELGEHLTIDRPLAHSHFPVTDHYKRPPAALALGDLGVSLLETPLPCHFLHLSRLPHLRTQNPSKKSLPNHQFNIHPPSST